MERITYRITLDTHKTGIQRTLQGFETADKKSRRITIGLASSSDTFEIPLDHVTAVMYVTTPDATEPSINECTIEDNTIVYDVLPIVTEGITHMQLKLIDTRPDGARSVLASPMFSVEVTESETNDAGAEQTTTFTALEEALARAKGVYDARLVSVEITPDCIFRAIYADGTVYENLSLNEALYNGNALLSESFAKGGTGIREGEDTDNAMYYKNVSDSVLNACRIVNEDCHSVLSEIAEKSVYTTFSVNFANGHLTYLSQNYIFHIDEEGNLQFKGQGEWIPTDATQEALANLVTELTYTITALEARVKALEA